MLFAKFSVNTEGYFIIGKNMNKKDKQKQLVRQRARFVCENPKCRKNTEGWYAHIIPDSWGGPYISSNLLFLCDECHRKFDYTVIKQQNPQAIEYMKLIRDVRKDNRLIENCFEFFGKDLIVRIGGGITLTNCRSIFRTLQNTTLLSACLSNGQILLNGVFYNEVGNVILTIIDNKFYAKGEDLWDLKITNNGQLDLINKTKKIALYLKQNDDSSINISGIIYLEGDIFEITPEGIHQISKNNWIKNCEQICGNGIILSSNAICF